jgi:[protein-PII] uridylyltransferase
VDDEVTVVAPDRPGLLSTVTGALAVHRLDVRSASVFADGPTGVTVCRVAPRFGSLPDWAVVRRDLRRALDGELDLEQVLASASRRTPPARRRTGAAGRRAARRRVGDRDGARGAGAGRAGRAPPHQTTSPAALRRLRARRRTAHIPTLGADASMPSTWFGPGGGPHTDPVLAAGRSPVGGAPRASAAVRDPGPGW